MITGQSHSPLYPDMISQYLDTGGTLIGCSRFFTLQFFVYVGFFLGLPALRFCAPEDEADVDADTEMEVEREDDAEAEASTCPEGTPSVFRLFFSGFDTVLPLPTEFPENTIPFVVPFIAWADCVRFRLNVSVEDTFEKDGIEKVCLISANPSSP